MPHKTEMDFQTESDLNTLREAVEIRKDSKRMKRVRELAKKQIQAVNKSEKTLLNRKS